MGLKANVLAKVSQDQEVETIEMLSIRGREQGVPSGTKEDGPWYQEKLNVSLLSDTYRQVHPVGFISSGNTNTGLEANALWPTQMVNNLERRGDGSQTGSISTQNGGNPYLLGQNYLLGNTDLRLNPAIPQSFTFYFWDPATLTYNPVALSYEVRNDSTAKIVSPAAGSNPYAEDTITGYFINTQGSTETKKIETTQHVFCQYTDLKFSGSVNRWVSPVVSTTDGTPVDFIAWYGQNSVTTVDTPYTKETSIYAIGKSLGTTSPWATIIDTAYPSITSSGIGEWHHTALMYDLYSIESRQVYPSIVNVRRNFDDPEERWVGTLSLCVECKPAGTRWDFKTQNELSRITSNHTYYAGDVDMPIGEYLPNSWGPYGNWTVLLNDDFTFGTYTYAQRIHSVDCEYKVSLK